MKATGTVPITADMIADGYTVGESVSIEELTEADARAIFGDAVYETWRAAQDEPRPRGQATVTSVGPCELTISDRPTSARDPK